MTVKSPLSNVMDAIKRGSSGLGRSNDEKSQTKNHADEQVIDLGDADLNEAQHRTGPTPPRREPQATFDNADDIVEGEFIEAQATKKRSAGDRFNGMSNGKKALLVGLVIAGALALKNQVDSPDITSKVEALNNSGMNALSTQDSAAQPSLNNTHEALELPQTELGKLSSATTPASGAKPGAPIGFDTSDNLALGTPSSTDNSNAAADSGDSPSFSLNGPFGDGLLQSESQQTLDAQTQTHPVVTSPVKPVAIVTPTPPAGPAALSQANTSTALVSPQGSELSTTDVAQQPKPAQALQNVPAQTMRAEPNPFEKTANDSVAQPAGFDTRFGGSDSPKLDSGKPVLGKADASSNVTTLKAELDAKDRRITEVEGRLKQVEDKLAGVQNSQPAKVKSSPVSKPVRHVATASKAPAKQKVVQASPVKVLPRPKLCVAAVAEPARNCSTCVAHAFITNRGQESMVGQGDYLDGYRVSIQGDRLDLQDDKGVVAHKFWSSPDGCRSI
jgi:hypothetical protein